MNRAPKILPIPRRLPLRLSQLKKRWLSYPLRTLLLNILFWKNQLRMFRSLRQRRPEHLRKNQHRLKNQHQ
jgi:hypothetical protein